MDGGGGGWQAAKGAPDGGRRGCHGSVKRGVGGRFGGGGAEARRETRARDGRRREESTENTRMAGKHERGGGGCRTRAGGGRDGPTGRDRERDRSAGAGRADGRGMDGGGVGWQGARGAWGQAAARRCSHLTRLEAKGRREGA
eukprot:12705461-Prorocentrum_lima.AAC.1